MAEILQHKHLIVTALLNEPPKCPTAIHLWIQSLIDDIGMKIMIGPFSAYSEVEGNRGLTAGAIIETSHLVLHVWDEVSPAKCELDLYSCGELNKEIIFEHIKKFDPINIEYKFLDRENGLIMLEEGIVHNG